MNKARNFEDFILDDYDYNLLEDWDLEYLWEWVEFDDFSDLEQDFYNSQGFDPDGFNEHDDTYNGENNDDYRYDVSENDDDDDNDENDEYHDDDDEHYEDKDNEYHDDDNENEDEYDFDFDFDDTTDDDNDDDTPDEQSDLHQDNINDDPDLEGDEFLRSIGLLNEDDNPNPLDDDEEYDEEDDDDELLGGPRYIETSVGTIDLELDDILGKLQKVEFDEFIDILQKNNHAYDKILIQQEWSEEEMDFLKSIEPLVRNTPDTHDAPKQEKPKKTKPTEQIPHKLINTQIYATAKEMFQALANQAMIAALKNQQKIVYTPKNIAKMWHIDDQQSREKRIKLMFGDTVKITDNKNKTMQKSISHVKHNHLPEIIYGKNEIRYHELREILLNEIKNMAETLDTDALNFIKADGKRFGLQFTHFLVEKYGTKIYYLYQSQMKNDISADRLSEDLTQIFNTYLSPKNTELFLELFFKAVIETLEKQGLEF